MTICRIRIIAAIVVCASLAVGADSGLVAHWDCNKGTGEILHDRSGNKNHGKIHGAKWVQSGSGYALQFNGVDNYVDCGNDPSLDITGPLTLQAWIMPTSVSRGEPGIIGKFFESYAITYSGSAHFYISSGGNYISGPIQLGKWLHITATFDGAVMRLYLSGMEVADKKSRYDTIGHWGRFTIGSIIGDQKSADPNLRNTAFFPGLIDDVRVYNRALTAREIMECYNEDAKEKGMTPFDVRRFGQFTLEPFFYSNDESVVLSVNYRWVLPVPDNAQMVAELAEAGSPKPISSQSLAGNDARCEAEAEFSLKGLPPGDYELRALVRKPDMILKAGDFVRGSSSVQTNSKTGRINLRGGWAEYDIMTGEGEYRLFIRAAHIYDSAGVRCIMDGKSTVEINLNGPNGNNEAAWNNTQWEAVGTFPLSAGRHTLRIETFPVNVSAKNKIFSKDVYIGAFALETVAPPTNTRIERVAFRLPFDPPVTPPSPAKQTVASLPAPVTPPAYQVIVKPGGGLVVQVAGQSFPIESSYSYPDGGFNRLTAGAHDASNEPEWRVSISNSTDKMLRITAAGKFYRVDRTVHMQPTRILIRDTIHNTWNDVLGVMLSNHVNLRDMEDAQVIQMMNPTIFVARGGVGMGLIALDDLYQLRQETSHTDGLAEIRDHHFGLDAGASCTVEWAIYPTATVDYYDFINQVRKDEGLHGHVAGAFSFGIRRDPPPAELVAMRNIAYISIGCLSKPLDNPATPLEGIEFMEYPKESAAIKDTFARTKALFPGIKVMFHVAHSLYMCNNPDKRFPNSRAMDTNGRQMYYGPNSFDYYGKHISQEMFNDNWRWWTFYPTEQNSFGKAMIAAMEYMVNEIGATGMWADGYAFGYVKGNYSYDCWDGRSVTIDPRTKRVTLKKNLVAWTALPVLKRCARIISDAGGVLISNGQPGPRSYWPEHTITSCETAGGDAQPVGALHLGRTVTPLGNLNAIKNERDYYRDILTKLNFGALYFWFGGPSMHTHKTLTEHMYPITFESIHSGIVRGRERIVTKNSGIYGWHGDDALHAVYLYDARGALIGHNFLTTFDQRSVRTEVTLKQDQSAAIVKIPVVLRASAPLNLIVRQYDPCAIRIALNGKGRVCIRVSNGDYACPPTRMHDVRVGERTFSVTARRDILAMGRLWWKKISTTDGAPQKGMALPNLSVTDALHILSFNISIDGPTELVIRPADAP